MITDHVDTKLTNVLRMQGFLNVLGKESGESVYVVNMSTPCTLNMDAKSMLKAPFRSSEKVLKAVKRSRSRLQKALTKLYPGHLVLSFDRTMIYEHLIKKSVMKIICLQHRLSQKRVETRCVCRLVKYLIGGDFPIQ